MSRPGQKEAGHAAAFSDGFQLSPWYGQHLGGALHYLSSAIKRSLRGKILDKVMEPRSMTEIPWTRQVLMLSNLDVSLPLGPRGLGVTPPNTTISHSHPDTNR